LVKSFTTIRREATAALSAHLDAIRGGDDDLVSATRDLLLAASTRLKIANGTLAAAPDPGRLEGPGLERIEMENQ
jgi:hypothetical protein